MGNPSIPNTRFEGAAGLARLLVDILDSVRFPRKGGALRVASQYTPKALGGNDPLTLVSTRGTIAFSFGEYTLLPVYLGGSIEAGNNFNRLRDVNAAGLSVAGTAFFGLDTPLGPLYVAYGLAEGGHSSGYLFLGQTF